MLHKLLIYGIKIEEQKRLIFLKNSKSLELKICRVLNFTKTTLHFRKSGVTKDIRKQVKLSTFQSCFSSENL